MAGKSVAVVLSAGKGTRMNSRTAKQYLLIKGKPVICYSLETFQDCPFIDEIVLVTGETEREYCREQIVERYHLTKVKKIVAGGKQRYHSVYNGICAAGECDYIYIHDGARPFVSRAILERARADVQVYGACVVGMPVKDTIKISDGAGFCSHTPDRSCVWQIQTPQVFSYSLIREAYRMLMEELERGGRIAVTDDAMVVEYTMGQKIRLTEGSYENLKITTPEDLLVAECYLQDRRPQVNG